MSIKEVNESFKRKYGNINKPLTEDAEFNAQLRNALTQAVQELKSRGNYNLKAYEDAFQRIIVRYFPDKPWWESVDLDIFTHLFVNRNPYSTIEAIMDSIKVSN